MTLEDIYKELEKLENNLEFYENRLEVLRTMVEPKATQFDKILVDGGKHTDNILKYVEKEDELQIENTIKYIKRRIYDLTELKDKEIKRLSKYGETVKAVVFLREKELILDSHRKRRHLTWEEIARKVHCSEKSARIWYKLGVEERKKAQ